MRCAPDLSKGYRLSSARAPFIEDDGSKVVLPIMIKVIEDNVCYMYPSRSSFENDLQMPRVRSRVPIKNGELKIFQRTISRLSYYPNTMLVLMLMRTS